LQTITVQVKFQAAEAHNYSHRLLPEFDPEDNDLIMTASMHFLDTVDWQC